MRSGSGRSGEEPRYVVGIDLGTTHTVVAFADRRGAVDEVRLFPIEQLVAPGEVAARALLPSVRYQPAPEELSPSDLRLPWHAAGGAEEPAAVVGELARELGAKVPGRLVASAKSWLSHPGVDRTAPILPWGAAEGVPRVSPVAASASYLAHVRSAWDAAYPSAPLAEQEIVLTVPASFDDVARTLTLEAARLAGLPAVRLLEEPQAALYDWVHRSGSAFEEALGRTRLLLVCDVGGGTTDLSLIRVEPLPGSPRLERIGVGDHLMLGGDNMDLALARLAEGRLGASERLTAASFSQLVQQCRSAKERFLGPEPPESATVAVLGSGARLVGGARTAELSRMEAEGLVVEGFFPFVPLEEHPRRARAALVEFGLPYAADPGVTRHVAAFLAAHAGACREAVDEGPPVPEAVLLNGGVFRSPTLADRLLEVLGSWRGRPLIRLVNSDPDLAVARGAVGYGLALLGRGIRIGGGSPRAYYLLVEAEGAERAVCLLPKGTLPGSESRLPGRAFDLRLGQPVRFLVATSSGDAPHRAGDLLDFDPDELVPLPPLATVLTGQAPAPSSREERVELAAGLTEVGTLEVCCVSSADPRRRWKLEFDLRSAREGATPAALGPAHPRAEAAAGCIERAYGSRSHQVDRGVRGLRADLEKLLGKRETWEAPLLRELFGLLWGHARRRKRTADHERVWLNLAGYCLRPGFGYPLDDWRVRELWALYPEGIQHGRELQVWSEWWTLWRRVAGGLPPEAQRALSDDIAGELAPPSGRSGRKMGPRKQGQEDMVRLAGALERVPAARKAQVGGWLLEGTGADASPSAWWTLGRLGSRVPAFGSAHDVVDRETAACWVEKTMAVDWKKHPEAAFAAALIARRSDDRERDLPPAVRTAVAARLRAARAPDSWSRMVETFVDLEASDQQRLLGESLPAGLRLAS